MRVDTKPKALAREAKSRCDQSENTKEPRLSSSRTWGMLSEVWGRRSCFSGPLFLSIAGALLLPGSCLSKSASLVSSQESWPLGQRGLPHHSGARLGELYRDSEEREGPEWTKVWNEHFRALSAQESVSLVCPESTESAHTGCES